MTYLPPNVVRSESYDLLEPYYGLPKQGKVRDVYENLPDHPDHMLVVTTDRGSSHDHVIGQKFPGKGRVLNGLAVHWFDQNIDPLHHLVAAGTSIDKWLRPEVRYNSDLQSRSMLVLKTKPYLVEFVTRGYLAGSGWRDYRDKDRELCGIKLPKGLREGDKLPKPIFTPSTKAAEGHDVNISEAEAAKLVPGGKATIDSLKTRSLAIYAKGQAAAEAVGIIIADDKKEFGLRNRKQYLIDEVLTPDSSRFWPKSAWQQLQAKDGGVPPSLDKEPLRRYLASIGFPSMSDVEAGKVVLPGEVVLEFIQGYYDILERLTGMKFSEYFYHRLGVRGL